MHCIEDSYNILHVAIEPPHYEHTLLITAHIPPCLQHKAEHETSYALLLLISKYIHHHKQTFRTRPLGTGDT